MALLWSDLGMGASPGIHLLSATPNGLATNSRCEFVWSGRVPARVCAPSEGVPMSGDPERTRCRSALADLYGADAVQPASGISPPG